MCKSILFSFILISYNGYGQQIEKEYFEDALKIVLSFETNSLNIDAAYDKVTGNFDGNGISLGLLQWNIGTGSLQRLVKEVGENTVLETMPTFGKNFWKACNSKISEGLKIANTWQVKNIIQSEQKKELVDFLTSPSVREIQYGKAMIIGKKAYNTSVSWAKEMRNSDSVLFKEFVYFFDLYTFNSGLKNLWVNDVISFKAQNENPKDTILNWLNTRKKPLYAIKDAKANFNEWGEIKLSEEELNLFVFGYLRALISNGNSGKFKADVLNRRGTICIGKGTVHGSHYDFEQIYSKHKY